MGLVPLHSLRQVSYPFYRWDIRSSEEISTLSTSTRPGVGTGDSDIRFWPTAGHALRSQLSATYILAFLSPPQTEAQTSSRYEGTERLSDASEVFLIPRLQREALRTTEGGVNARALQNGPASCAFLLPRDFPHGFFISSWLPGALTEHARGKCCPGPWAGYKGEWAVSLTSSLPRSYSATWKTGHNKNN